jgi:hypothetical protein
MEDMSAAGQLSAWSSYSGEEPEKKEDEDEDDGRRAFGGGEGY